MATAAAARVEQPRDCMEGRILVDGRTSSPKRCEEELSGKKGLLEAAYLLKKMYCLHAAVKCPSGQPDRQAAKMPKLQERAPPHWHHHHCVM